MGTRALCIFPTHLYSKRCQEEATASAFIRASTQQDLIVQSAEGMFVTHHEYQHGRTSIFQPEC